MNTQDRITVLQEQHTLLDEKIQVLSSRLKDAEAEKLKRIKLRVKDEIARLEKEL